MNIEDQINSWDCAKAVAELTSELIRFPSVNPSGDLIPIADFVQNYLTDLGLPTERISAKPEYPCLIGLLDKGPGPTLIFNGHMDVVPIGDRERWKWDPFSGDERDGYIVGRGASDMKGGLAALMVALSRISVWDHLKGKILFMAVPDEETGGDFGTRFLVEKGYTGDACLIGEPSGQNPTIGQKGNIWLKAETVGVPAHGSLSPVGGANAVLRMTRLIEAVYEVWETRRELPEEARALIRRSQELLRNEGITTPAEVLGRVSVNVGKIRGGQKVNMIPDRCEAEFDLRVPIGITTQEVLDEIKQKAKQRLGQDVRITLQTKPNEPNYTDPENDFVKLTTSTIERVTGKPSRPVLQWASSDARFFRYKSIPTIQYGPVEPDGIHGYNERIRISELGNAAKVYALLAHRYLGG